jgi:hypothetical protein
MGERHAGKDGVFLTVTGPSRIQPPKAQMTKEEMTAWVKSLKHEGYTMNELSQWSTLIRDKFIQHTLRTATVADFFLPGFGPTLKERLMANGYHTAADVNRAVYRVPGIGAVKGQVREEWRRSVERSAARSPLAVPSQADIAAVKQKHDERRRELTLSIQQTNAEEQTAAARVKAQFGSEYAGLEAKRTEAKREYDERVSRATKSCNQRKKEIEEHFKTTQDAANAKVRQITKQIKEVRRDLFGKQLEFSRSQQELGRYREISFLRFVVRACGLPHRARSA